MEFYFSNYFIRDKKTSSPKLASWLLFDNNFGNVVTRDFRDDKF